MNPNAQVDAAADAITENVLAVNDANCKDERTKVIFSSLVKHLHAFVRETELTTDEWMTAIKFLTETGKGFSLISDALGVSSIVDCINNFVKPPGTTEATVLGPFYTEDAHEVEIGESIASEGKGDYMFIEGKILDTKGNPIAGAVIDAWETDGDGLYDNQYEDGQESDCRGRLRSSSDGSYSFRGVVPVSYSIPFEGPAARMMNHLGRHFYRPAHLHMMVYAPGYEKLITQFYFEGDPYLESDAIFGVKKSLIVVCAFYIAVLFELTYLGAKKPDIVTDEKLTKARGFKDARPHAYIKKNIVLATPEEIMMSRRG